MMMILILSQLFQFEGNREAYLFIKKYRFSQDCILKKPSWGAIVINLGYHSYKN